MWYIYVRMLQCSYILFILYLGSEEAFKVLQRSFELIGEPVRDNSIQGKRDRACKKRLTKY